MIKIVQIFCSILSIFNDLVSYQKNFINFNLSYTYLNMSSSPHIPENVKEYMRKFSVTAILYSYKNS